MIKMLLDMLTEKEKEMMNYYREVYAYENENIDKPASLDYVLRFWNEEKKDLFQLLGDQLIVSKSIEIERPIYDLQKDIEKNLLGLDDDFYFWYMGFIDKEFIIDQSNWWLRSNLYGLINSNYLACNKYTGETFEATFSNGQTLKFPSGAKVLKLLAKIAKMEGKEDLFEKFRLKHSLILNQKKLKGELCLSIHPMDYMTMSDNESNWSSCMSWSDSGCYRRGTVEMMNSPYVVVAYLKSKNDMTIKDDLTWNNKKWRELFIVTKEFITSIKAYPYASDELTSISLDMLVELAEKNLKWEYSSENIKYEIYSYFCVNDKQYRLDFDTNTMYNDFDTDGITPMVRMGQNAEPKTYSLNYSGYENCMFCGTASGDFMYGDCDENGNLVCYECANISHCEYCGSDIYDEYDVNTVDGVTLCDRCFNNLTVSTPDDNQYHLKSNTDTIYVFESHEEMEEALINNNFNFIPIISVYDVDNLSKDFMNRYFIIDEFHFKKLNSYENICYILRSEITEEGTYLLDV